MQVTVAQYSRASYVATLQPTYGIQDIVNSKL
ncbi:hypothetical protein Pan258_46050 [Symmachiella dynata]|nr:hypothetical protein Pan258_46050 [Symmachiella dynata]